MWSLFKARRAIFAAVFAIGTLVGCGGGGGGGGADGGGSGIQLVAEDLGNVRQLTVDAAGHPVATTVEISAMGAVVRVRKFGPQGELLPVNPTDGFLRDAAGNGYTTSLISTSDGINVITREGGSLTRIAATGETTQLADWPANSPGAMAPAQMTVAADGTVYFVDLITGYLVRWTAAEGIKVLGDLDAAEPTTGIIAGPRHSRWLTADGSGRVYVLSQTLLQRFENGALSTVAGERGLAGTADGVGAQARFRASFSPAFAPMVTDAAGNVFIAERDVIRKVTPEGVVTTVAGGETGAIMPRTGPPGSLAILWHIAVAPDGTLYVVSGTALVRVKLQ